MTLLIIFASYVTYLFCHFLLYFFYLRNNSNFYCEQNIFLYHCISFFIFCVLLVLTVNLIPEFSFLYAAGLLACHGIYSLSFLELWSLAEGGYSLTIMRKIKSRNFKNQEEIINYFAIIGDQKKTNRLSSLEKLNLIKSSNEDWELTYKGQMIANILRLLRWLPKLKATG